MERVGKFEKVSYEQFYTDKGNVRVGWIRLQVTNQV